MAKIMDLFIYSGWKIMYQVVLSIIKEIKEKIYQVDEDHIVDLIRQYTKNLDENKVLL